MAISVSVNDGVLVVTDDNSSIRIQPDKQSVTQAIHVESIKGIIVLLDYMNYSGSNLICCEYNGDIRWKAHLPFTMEGRDCFVRGVRMTDGFLMANTYSGYFMKIDVSTGRTIETEFTK